MEQVVRELSVKYNFDFDEAMEHVGSKKKTSTVVLPWTGKENPEWCCGLRWNHGLLSQCRNARRGKSFCATCTKQSEQNASGKPTYGTTTDRSALGLMEYCDPKTKRPVIPYGNVIKKLNISRRQAEKEAARFGLKIPDEQFEIHQGRHRRKQPTPPVGKQMALTDDLIGHLIVQSKKKMANELKPTLAEAKRIEKELTLKSNKSWEVVEDTDEEDVCLMDAEGVEESKSNQEERSEETAAAEEEEEEGEIEVVHFTEPKTGHKYLLDNTNNMLYDITTHEPVGVWNETMREIR